MIRNPLNVEARRARCSAPSSTTRTRRTLQGIEVEARKSLDFARPRVARVPLARRQLHLHRRRGRSHRGRARPRARPFFGAAPGPADALHRPGEEPAAVRSARVDRERRHHLRPARLGHQGDARCCSRSATCSTPPAAPSSTPSGESLSFTPDRYIDSFYQLDLIMSKTWRVDFLRGDLTFKVSIKNLTDSTRADHLRPRPDRERDRRALLQGRARLLVLAHLRSSERSETRTPNPTDPGCERRARHR